MQIMCRLQKQKDRFTKFKVATFSKVFAIALGAACLYAGSVDMFHSAKWSFAGMPVLLVGLLVLSTIERKV